MQINFDYTPSDHYEFSKAFAAKQNTHKYNVAIFAGIALLFIFADLIYAIVSGSLDFSSGWPLMHLFLRLCVYFAVLIIVIFTLNYFGTKLPEIAVGSEPNGLFCGHILRLEEDGFWEATDVNAAFYSWRGIESVSADEKFLLITIRASSIIAIPKRCLSPEQTDHFLLKASELLSNSHGRFIPSSLDTEIWNQRTEFNTDRSIAAKPSAEID